MSSFTRQQLESYLKNLDVKADAVIDVGGSQLPVKDRVRSFDVRRYEILDLEQPHKGQEPDIVWDLNEYGIDTLPKDAYDMAFCLEVMEYIHSPLTALENIAYMLKEGGTLHISFPFVYPQHEPINDDMLRYTRIGAIRLLALAGLYPDTIVPRKTYKGGLRALYLNEGMRPANGADHEEVGYIIKAIKKSI